jgi:tetratricopeptide (TPR) repeat protein
VIESLRWLVLPWPFDVDHGVTPSPWWEAVLGWLGIAALGALIGRQARPRPWLAFGIAWVLAGCGVAALDVLRHQYGAILEQKLYLIAPGLCLLGGLLVERVCQFDTGSLERAGALVAVSELMAIMVICAGAAVIWLLPDLAPKAVQTSPKFATAIWAAVVVIAWLLIFARQLRPEPRLVTTTAWQICILEFAVLGMVAGANWRALGFSSEVMMLRETLASHRGSGYAHLALGRLLLDARQHDQAGKQFLLAAVNNWNYYETFGNLGEVAMHRRDFKRAENCYREALRLNPQGTGAQLRLGNALHGQKRHAEARTIYLQLLKTEPHPPELYELLADTYVAENRLQEANNVLRSYPGSFKVRLRLATMLHQQKRYADAREIYKQLIAEQPRIPRLYELLAAAYDAEDRVYEAGRVLEQAKRLRREAAAQSGDIARRPMK